VGPTGADEAFETAEVDLFVGRNYVVTLHRGDVPALQDAIKRWDRTDPELRREVGFLVHTIADTVIDAYFPIVDAMEDKLDSLELSLFQPDTPFVEVVRLFTTTRTPALYVGDAAGNLVGVIELHAVKEILAAQELSNLIIAQDLAEPARSVPADASLATVSEKLWFVDAGEAPVVEDGPGSRFLGVVTQRDLLGFLDREILRRNLLLAEVRWRDGLEKGIDFLELPEGYRLEKLEVPSALVGKTLEEAQLRARHGLNVIAVTSVDDTGNERRVPPQPDYRLAPGDQLVAVAASEDVDAFTKLRGRS
jgi:hypothetical protein